NQWVDEAVIPTSARLYGQGEIGPALLLPNGHAFFLGATGHTAIYTPPTGGAPTGSWAAGPDIPMSRVSCDAPAVMMANGKILLAVGSTCANGGSPQPTWFYEYDYSIGANGAFAATSSPGNPAVGSKNDAPAGNFTFLALPDGTALASQGADATGQLYVYTPDSPQLVAGKPKVISITTNADGGYRLTGLGLNG